MLRFLSQRRVQVILLLMLLGAALFVQWREPPGIERLRQITFDYYNRLMPRPPGNQTVIVDIDEESLKRYGQWPWPRTTVAKLPEILKSMGAKVTAFDMVFAETDRTSPGLIAATLPDTPGMKPVVSALKNLPDNDSQFATKIKEAGNVVMGYVAASQHTTQKPLLKAAFLNTGINPNPLKFVPAYENFSVDLPELTTAAAGNGSFTEAPEQDGIIRRVPLLIGRRDPDGQVRDMYPALSLETLRVALDKSVYKVESYSRQTTRGYGIKSVTVGDYTVPTDERGRIWVYYTGHRPQIYVPAWKVLTGQVPAEVFKDKIVFIGTSTIGLLDIRSSPLSLIVPGVEIHAEIAEQILQKTFLQRSRMFSSAELFITALISLFIIFLSPFITAGTLALTGIAAIGSGFMAALYAYKDYGLLFDPVYPSLTVVIIFILSSILTNLRSETERRAVRLAFSHYISPALMEELTADPDKLKLGGEVRELSVMFTDIRNFTSISETMDPAELIRMMNDFLTPMTSCVLNNRGTIDKYMGDAMMAFWNAPLDDPDHAVHACTSALQMLEALRTVNENLKKAGKTIDLRAGIGINTGRASVGNMGSKQRFAYSALGDTVNLASRLEGQTKGYGISVMISEQVRKKAPAFAAIEVDLLTVKGRKEPERVYALLGDAALAQDADFRKFAGFHNDLLSAYRAQKWDEAEEFIRLCTALKPELAGLYALYAQRIAEFRHQPPAAGWQGVWVAKDKH